MPYIKFLLIPLMISQNYVISDPYGIHKEKFMELSDRSLTIVDFCEDLPYKTYFNKAKKIAHLAVCTNFNIHHEEKMIKLQEVNDAQLYQDKVTEYEDYLDDVEFNLEMF